MSGQIKLTTTVLAGTTNVNLLTGRKQEFLSRPAVVTLYQVQDSVSLSRIETDLTLGNVVVGEDLVANSNPASSAGVGTGPKTNEDMVARGVGAAGDRIQIRVREVVGGTGDDGIIRTLVTIDDL